MFGNLSYLVWMLIFTVPPLVVVWAFKYKLLAANWRTITIAVLTGILWWIVSEPVVPLWHPWFFSPSGIIGIWLWYAPIEDLVFSLLTPLTISSVAIALIDREQRGRLFSVPFSGRGRGTR